METMLEAMARLRELGYLQDLSSLPGGRLRCSSCDEVVDASEAVIDEIVRYEGASDPDDEEILAAITTPAGHKGLFLAAYGPATPADDVAVLRALGR